MNLNKILTAIAVFLAVFIIAASAIVIFKRNAVPGEGLRKIDPKAGTIKNIGKMSFDLIGQLRISVKTAKNENRCVLIVNPWLEYDETDTALYEELDQKLQAIKSIFMQYFQAKTKGELLSMTENQIKTELKQKINESLILGQVSEIYFNDYIFLN